MTRALFQPIQLRGVTLDNRNITPPRIVVPPRTSPFADDAPDVPPAG